MDISKRDNLAAKREAARDELAVLRAKTDEAEMDVVRAAIAANQK